MPCLVSCNCDACKAIPTARQSASIFDTYITERSLLHLHCTALSFNKLINTRSGPGRSLIVAPNCDKPSDMLPYP